MKLKGRIIKAISGEYTVEVDNQSYVCKPRGVFRHNKINPLVGDIATIETEGLQITEIHKRKNELLRPTVTNIDKVFLVFSVISPDLNLNLLDRMLAYYEYLDIECVIVLTKYDLLEDKDKYNKEINYYKSLGYDIIKLDINSDASDVIKHAKGYFCVVAGQSGVGKSTLLNKFGYQIKTDEISQSLNRGKHTTRHVEALKVDGGFICDTPGFGLIDLDMDVVSLSQNFKEFWLNHNNCKYNCCTHLTEPNCEIKRLVETNEILSSRYENYLSFVNEINQKNKKKKY